VLILLIVSVALHGVLVGLGLLFFGAEGAAGLLGGALELGGMPVTGQSLVVWPGGGAGGGDVRVLRALHHRQGLRATAINRVGARLMGISTELSGDLSFAWRPDRRRLGPADRALTTIYYDTGFLIGLKGFVAAIVGGLASYPLALGGACWWASWILLLLLGQRLQGGAGVHPDHSRAVVALAQQPPCGGRRMSARQLTLACIAALALVWGFLPEFTLTVLNYIGLYALVAAGLVLLTGVGGMTSFGQAAFVGLGAYATAWVCTSAQVQAGCRRAARALLPWLGLLLGLLATCGGRLLGAVTLRCRPLPAAGHHRLGPEPVLPVRQPGVLGASGMSGCRLRGGFSLASPLYLGPDLGRAAAGAVGAAQPARSREGRAIRALKGGRVMAESMGVDTARIKLFVLAALLAAVSGWLYAHLQRFVNPTPFNLNIGIEYLFMAVVGGAGHLWGAVLGATLITLLKEQLQDWLPGCWAPPATSR
jgi:ABC-type branched-subunit amino acid transport system permease subunit